MPTISFFLLVSVALIFSCLLANRDIARVLLRALDFNASARHVFDVPRSKLHLLSIYDLDGRLFNRLLVHVKLLMSPMRANLVILALFVRVIGCLVPLSLLRCLSSLALLGTTANIASYLIQLSLHVS